MRLGSGLRALLLGGLLLVGACGGQGEAGAPRGASERADVVLAEGGASCAREPRYRRSALGKAFGRVELSAVRICRYRSVDGQPGGRPGGPLVGGSYELVQRRLLGQGKAVRLLRLFATARPSQPRCHMIDSLPPVTDVVTFIGLGDEITSVAVSHPRCLGFDTGGRHWAISPELRERIDAWLRTKG